MDECLILVKKGKMLTDLSSIYFNLVDITPDMEQLYSIHNGDVLLSIVDKLKSMSKEKFSMKLQSPRNFSYTTTSKRNLKKNIIFMRLSTRNIDQRLPNSESRLIRFQLKVEDRIKFRSGKRACPLCFSNDIGDEKHSVYFPRTNPKLVGIRKTLIPKIHETFTPYPDINPISHGGGGGQILPTFRLSSL